MKDRFLLCLDCGDLFRFSAVERDYYRHRGYQEPCHCRNCRDKRRNAVAQLSRRMKRKGWL